MNHSGTTSSVFTIGSVKSRRTTNFAILLKNLFKRAFVLGKPQLIHNTLILKLKVKVILEQATKAQRGLEV